MVSSQHTVLDVVRLVWEESGAAGAAPLVPLHALGESRRDWDVVLPRLADRCRVIAVDLRGHGNSGWPVDYSSQLMADDVLRLLDHLGLAAVTLLGHSLGGSVAYLLAEQHPDRIERLIIEDAPPPFPRDRPVPERPDVQLDFDWAVVPAIVGEINRGAPTTWDRLSTITAPTLLIGGGHDSRIPQDRLRDVAERIPNSTLITIRAGHHVHRAQPVEYADAVLAWLDETAPRGPTR